MVLATAGHCIKKIEELTERYGYEISYCSLIDALGLGAKHFHPIPFVYKDANPTCISDEFDFDYGFIEISPYYQQLLLENNVEPLNEDVWKKQPKKVDFYALLGIPAELVKVNSKSIELNPTIFTIEQIHEKPEGFIDTKIPLFYGRIGLGEDLNSIIGVSGGPIFGFYSYENGELRYWLTALQSRWLPKSHYISACPTFILGEILEELLARIDIK